MVDKDQVKEVTLQSGITDSRSRRLQKSSYQKCTLQC
ncbi:MAG: hypothetical protein ACLTX6_01280 [Lachnospiraceae bacterium]